MEALKTWFWTWMFLRAARRYREACATKDALLAHGCSTNDAMGMVELEIVVRGMEMTRASRRAFPPTEKP